MVLYTLDAAIYIATLDTYYGITYTGDDDDNIAIDEIVLPIQS